LKHASSVLATSPSYAKGSPILRKFEFGGKLEIVPNFVDPRKFSPKNKEKIGKKYSFPGGKKRRIILFLGRLIPYKGVKYLLRAFPQVKKEIKNSLLIIAGRGPLKESLLRESRGMEGTLFIEPQDDELPPLYAISDVFVLPSVTRQEAFGITLLEAMSSGKPCISTNISGMPSVIGDAGILVPPEDNQALSEAIIKILTDGKLAKRLGKKARERVVKNFTGKKAVDKLMEVYEKCL
jgi:glycosyltransferase involved in cell wall biosynthesis